MRRYWWPDLIDESETELKIDGELFKHIFVVCRRAEGDHFELLQGDKAYLVQVLELEKKSAKVGIKSTREVTPLKKPYIHLVLSFSNPKVVDRVLEKSVELGVKSFQLVSTANSFLKDQKTLNSKTERAEKIVKQAMQQSGRGELMELKAPLSLQNFLEDFSKVSNKVGFMFYEGESSQIDSSNNHESDPEDVYVLIGSEGGFTTQEATLAQKSGFEVLSLGDQILRVETACVASISILKSSFGIW